jgi:P-type E1-E2 ATPase
MKGLGISGNVAGKRIFVGNQRLAAEFNCKTDAALAARADEWESEGRTIAYFGADGVVQGVLSFGDRIKPEAADVIRDLKSRGIGSLILSGDSAATTQFVALQVGADDFCASALPLDKTAAIETLQKNGNIVAMIGDGINDAPALAQADLGIAMGSGTDIAMKAADVVLVGDSLTKLLAVTDLSKKTWRVVRQNLFWAFFYNTLGMSLAVTGVLNPIAAAGAMFLSSLSVIGNSMRLNRKKT